MTRTLILIRHCKSDWDGSTDDHDRPLSARGAHAAPRIGAYLAERGFVPDVVLCSDAVRTRQTWAAIADQLPSQPALTLSPALYLAEPEVMLHAIQATSSQTVALIGHNPGIAALAWAMVQSPPSDARFGQYPTGATTILRFEDGFTPGTGRLADFTTPRDL